MPAKKKDSAVAYFRSKGARVKALVHGATEEGPLMVVVGQDPTEVPEGKAAEYLRGRVDMEEVPAPQG